MGFREWLRGNELKIPRDQITIPSNVEMLTFSLRLCFVWRPLKVSRDSRIVTSINSPCLLESELPRYTR